MKKIFILITTIILALSMVSCNIQEFINGWGTTSTTSGEMTTTTTTTAPDPKFKTLQELIENIKFDAVTLWFHTANMSITSDIDTIDDFDYIFDTFIKDKEVLLSNDKDYVNNKGHMLLEHSKFGSLDNIDEQFIGVMSFYVWNEDTNSWSRNATMFIYYEGSVEIYGSCGNYITVESNAIDLYWLLNRYDILFR